jgi:hypothetical protein
VIVELHEVVEDQLVNLLRGIVGPHAGGSSCSDRSSG